jgi:hypothetical protein
MRWGIDMRSRTLLASGALSASLVLAGCAGASDDWAWQPSEDETPAPEAHYYYDYAEADEFMLGETTAVVRFTDLENNVLVPGTESSEPWTYTPGRVEIVEPGDSGLNVGDTVALAIPGGTAEGITTASLWTFDKAEIDAQSRYVISWTQYDYPLFELSHVLEFLYEYHEEDGELHRLQANPEQDTEMEEAVFGLEAEPITISGDSAGDEAVEAVESLAD